MAWRVDLDNELWQNYRQSMNISYYDDNKLYTLIYRGDIFTIYTIYTDSGESHPFIVLNEDT